MTSEQPLHQPRPQGSGFPSCPACEGTINPHAIRCPVCVAIMHLRNPTGGPVTGFSCSSCGTEVPLRAIRLLLETQPPRRELRREIATAALAGYIHAGAHHANLNPKAIADLCVSQADALIEALRTIPAPKPEAPR